MRRQLPASAAVRDQIVAALHDAYPLALTTRELADRLPPVVVRINCDCRSAGCELPDLWIGECRLSMAMGKSPSVAIRKSPLVAR